MNLAKRIFGVCDLCPLCGSDRKIEVHLFIHYRRVREVWSLTRFDVRRCVIGVGGWLDFFICHKGKMLERGILKSL